LVADITEENGKFQLNL